MGSRKQPPPYLFFRGGQYTLATALWLTSCLLAPTTGQAEGGIAPSPSPQDTCLVCGMFVALHPDWVAAVLYQDGRVHYFDGAKDLFKYLLNMPKYASNYRSEHIAAIQVTEYYGTTRIDARAAWYVLGSDVLGPMGHELVPLATREEAEEFLKDHRGKRLLRFEDVDPKLLERLDQGQWE